MKGGRGLLTVCLILALGAAAFFALRWRGAAEARDALQQRAMALAGETEALQAEAEIAAGERDALNQELDAAQAGEAELERRLSAANTRIAELEALAERELRRQSVAEHHRVSQGRYRSETADFPYLLYAPGEPDPERKLPLLVYLHGTGGRGRDPEQIYTENCLPNFLRDGLLTPDALVLMPQCPEGSNWYETRFGLMELIEAVATECGADRDRISVTGFSMGGIGCFALLTEWPEFFSAAAPFAATFSPTACAVITSTPVRMRHGSADYGMGFDVVEIDRIIRQAGGESELILYSGEGHTIQNHYLDDKGSIVEWLISASRGS